MVYTQRHSGLFIRQPLIPQADLQADNVFPEGQYLEPGISQVLAYSVGTSPLGQRLLQLDSQGRQVESLGLSKLINIVAPRTDIATVLLQAFTLPEFTAALLYVRVTAVSGTTPSLTVAVQAPDSQGLFSSNLGGVSLVPFTAVGVVTQAFTVSATSAAVMMAPGARIATNISGTAPSFTWYADLLYK